MSTRLAFRICTISSILGFLASAYLMSHHLTLHLGGQTTPSLCAINSTINCDTVALSEYSEIFGIPVAGGGLFYFAFWFLMLRRFRTSIDSGETWSLFRFVSALGLIPVVILATIAVAKIGSICIVCVFSYLMTLLIGVASFRVSVEKRGAPIKQLFAFVFRSPSGQFDLTNLFISIFFAALFFLAPAVVLANHRANLPAPTAAELVEKEFQRWKSQPVRQIEDASGTAGADFAFGPKDAAHNIVVFSDFACPACKHADRAIKNLAKKHRLRVAFKNFPLDSNCHRLVTRPFHQFSCAAAEIARCAGVESTEKFWQVAEELFSIEELNKSELEKLREKLNTESPSFSACLASGREIEAVKRDIELGISLGLQATPSVFIDGKAVNRPTEETLLNLVTRIVANDPK